MYKKLLSIGLGLLILLSSAAAQAEDYGNPEIYAQDKLVNATAQLERLKAQEKALEKLIKAVKKDLRAAKLRAKAERVQKLADTARQDASIVIEQSGIAIDLPDLMSAKGVQAGLAQGSESLDQTKEDIDLMFKDKQSEEAVFFPADGTTPVYK